MRSIGKLGSSRATTKASSCEIIVGVKLESLPCSPIRPRSTGPFSFGVDRDFLLLALLLLSSARAWFGWAEGFSLNLEIRSFCVVDFLD